MKNLLKSILLLLLLLASCSKTPDNTDLKLTFNNGVFIVDEGNFRGGNGSLSFFSYDSSKIYNDLFHSINGRQLGDVPNSMVISGEKAYIVVNNSGTIEVINSNTLESEAAITGLNSPRNMALISGTTAYVTSMYSDSVTIVNLSTNSISGYINIRRSSESIVVTGNKAYVSSWVGGNEVMILNTSENKVADSIVVGVEPESSVLDKNKTLWVLCNGGWARENFAVLTGINTTTNTIEKNIIFPSKLDSPGCLQINGSGDTLFYLQQGVRRMSIDSPELPTEAFIPESGHFFYKLSIDPLNRDIYTTDAVDYQQSGYLLRYSGKGVLKSSSMTDIIPGMMCYKHPFLEL